MPTAVPDLEGLSPETVRKATHDYERALDRIKAHAEVHFGRIPDPGRRDDAIADMLGIGWRHWLSALRHRKDPNQFISVIADKAVRHVRAGRRVWKMERSKDVLSPRAQRNHSFMVEQLPGDRRSHEDIYGDPDGQRDMDAAEERLQDNRITPIPEQAAFREQWKPFLDEIGNFKRPIVEDLAAGADTNDVARKYGKWPGRVSQIRREAEQTWHRIDQTEPKGRL